MKFKISIIDIAFTLVFVAKFINLGSVKQTYLTLIICYIIASIIIGIFQWLINPETGKKIAEKMYIQRNKKALAKAEKEAKKVIKQQNNGKKRETGKETLQAK